MNEARLLLGGHEALRLGAFGREEAHERIGEGGYLRLLDPLVPLETSHPAIAITPWAISLHLPALGARKAFDGILGGTPVLWWSAGLGAPAETGKDLLSQAIAWVATMRRSPSCLPAGPGAVGAARRDLGELVQKLVCVAVVRVDG